MKTLGSSFKVSKTAMLIPLFALSMHSCKESNETGIVKDKIDNQVFLTPVNDTNYVYRVIDFNSSDRKTKNIYLNINKGDTILFHNINDNIEVRASQYFPKGIIGSSSTLYNVLSINGVPYDSLPDLIYKQKHDAEIKALNEKYNNLLRQH
jgi:hypothetical protein